MMRTAVVFGVAIVGMSIFTNYEGGAAKIIPMGAHLPPLLLLVAAVSLGACSTTTRITGSWKDPAVDASTGESKSVLIVPLSRNIELRTKLEDALAAKAAEQNIEAVKSSDIFTPDFFQVLPGREELLGQIKQTGVDAILTVSLIDTESETRYVRGSTHYAPMPVYSWYGGFYTYLIPSCTIPGITSPTRRISWKLTCTTLPAVNWYGRHSQKRLIPRASMRLPRSTPRCCWSAWSKTVY